MLFFKSMLGDSIFPIALKRILCRKCTMASTKLEPVYSFPPIKYISLINRLKVYQIIGTSLGIPSSGLLEVAGIVPDHTFILATYIGLTATALLTLGTLPFRNVIGFLYISEDNKLIKISSVNFWGKRIDKIISVEDWIPLLDLPQKKLDMIYLSPQLSDGTTYKLFIRSGNLLNARKIGQVLE